MVRHQAVGNHGNVKFFDVTLYLLQQKHIILIVQENVRSIRAAIVDVIVIVGEERGFSSCHESPPCGERASHLFKQDSAYPWILPVKQTNPTRLVRRTRTII